MFDNDIGSSFVGMVLLSNPTAEEEDCRALWKHGTGAKCRGETTTYPRVDLFAWYYHPCLFIGAPAGDGQFAEGARHGHFNVRCIGQYGGG